MSSKQKIEFLTKTLTTYEDEDAAELSSVKAEALQLIGKALAEPDLFNFDAVSSLKAVQHVVRPTLCPARVTMFW